MWRVLTQLPTLLAELLMLSRETNALLRELSEAIRNQPSRVPVTAGSTVLPPPPRPIPSRKLQATDITTLSRQDRIDYQAKEQDHQRRPWADPSRSGLVPPAADPPPPAATATPPPAPGA